MFKDFSLVAAIIVGLTLTNEAQCQSPEPIDWSKEIAWDSLLFSIAIGAEIGGRVDRRDKGNRGFPSSYLDDWVRDRLHGEEKSAEISNRESAADLLSDVTLNSEIAGAILLPMFTGAPETKWKLAVTIKAFALQTATSSTLKHTVRRQRPKAYYNDDYPDSLQSRLSFPSGHSAAAFTAATALSQLNPEWPLIGHIGLYGLATTTAYLRIVADRHFFTDTAVGAVIGVGVTSLALAWNNHDRSSESAHDVRLGFTGDALVLQKEF